LRPDSIRQDRCGRLRGRCPAHQHSGARTPSAAFGPARERLAAFLDLPIDLIGQIGAGRNRTTGLIDVAIVQSLYRKGEVKDLVAEYGHILVDEYHHLSAVSFEQVMRRAPAKYVTGLTATPLRKDGHHPIIYMQCGPIRFNVPVGRKSSQARLNTGVVPRTTAITWNQQTAPKIRNSARCCPRIQHGTNRSFAMLWRHSVEVPRPYCRLEGRSILIASPFGCGSSATACFFSRAA